MITEIGIAAGEIWDFLDKRGEVGLEELIVGVGKPRELTLMGLGWLAREGYVLVKRSSSGHSVILRDKEEKLA